MNNREKYDLFAEGDISMESNMAIVPRSSDFVFTASHIKLALNKMKDFKLLSFVQEDDKRENSISDITINIQVRYKGEKYDVSFYIIKMSDLKNIETFGFANYIDDESLRLASLQAYALAASMYFIPNSSLDSFHLQIKILSAVVPNSSLAIDFMSHRLLSPIWMKMAAQSAVAPSPEYLYTLHCVVDNESDIPRYWFHTHGLQRCGSVELEMLNIGHGSEQMNMLMNATARRFLSNPAKERERFAIGYDGMGINLCWLRWEEALKDFSANIVGGFSDREGDGNTHFDPGGVLYAVEDGNMMSPEIYTSTLSNNPVYYVTTEETNRMSTLAKERFDLFRDTFEIKYERLKRKNMLNKIIRWKKWELKWDFLVKLGLLVDNAGEDEEKEHLWFDVLAISEKGIKAKLLNQPYWLHNIRVGDVKIYPFDLLTDWIIYASDNDNIYTPDTIYQLKQSI